MPRKPRFYLPGIPAHIVQRGNDRQAVFFADSDYQVYLDWMFEGAQRKRGQYPLFKKKRVSTLFLVE